MGSDEVIMSESMKIVPENGGDKEVSEPEAPSLPPPPPQEVSKTTERKLITSQPALLND